MVTVRFPEPHRYFAYLDEENFFEWIGRIPVVSSIGGDKGVSIELETAEIDDQSAEEFAAIVARYDLDIELLGSLLRGKAVSLEKKVGPESVILTDRPLNGFLLALRPVFYSRLDERGFDDWLKGIQPRYSGLDKDKTAVLELKSDDVNVTNVFDLIAICRRYNLNLSRLRCLCEIADREYFDDKERNWHEQIFGAPRSS